MDPRAIGRPVGPLPPAVYWCRRGFALLAALLVVYLIGRVFGGGAAAEPTPPRENPPPAVDAAAPPAPSPATPTAEPSAAPPAKPRVTSCGAGAVAVRVRADAARYASGREPRFTLEFGNVSRAACRLDVGPRALEVQVRSGADRVWSSDDCFPSKRSEVRRFAPGERDAVVVTWQGDRSAPGCPDTGTSAKPGTYVVTGRVGKVSSEAAVFVLL